MVAVGASVTALAGVFLPPAPPPSPRVTQLTPLRSPRTRPRLDRIVRHRRPSHDQHSRRGFASERHRGLARKDVCAIRTDRERQGTLFAPSSPCSQLIGSAPQIMWPRLDSGQLASVGGRKLGGFVAYLRRPDAERAAKEMDGVEWGDNVIKISWGKAVPIASRALYGTGRPLTQYPTRCVLMSASPAEPEPDSEYYREREHHRGHRTRRRSRSRSRSHSPTEPEDVLRPRKRRSVSPSSRTRSSRGPRAWPELEIDADEQLLVTVAKKVRDYGKPFEEVLREREKGNPRFAFLQDDQVRSSSGSLRYRPPRSTGADAGRACSALLSTTSACSSIRTTSRHLSPSSRTRSVVFRGMAGAACLTPWLFYTGRGGHLFLRQRRVLGGRARRQGQDRQARAATLRMSAAWLDQLEGENRPRHVLCARARRLRLLCERSRA